MENLLYFTFPLLAWVIGLLVLDFESVARWFK